MTFRISSKIWSLINSPEKYAGRRPEVASNETESDLWMTIDIDIRPINLTDSFVDNDSKMGYTLPIHDEPYRIRDNYSDINSMTDAKLVYVHGTMKIDMTLQIHEIAEKSTKRCANVASQDTGIYLWITIDFHIRHVHFTDKFTDNTDAYIKSFSDKFGYVSFSSSAQLGGISLIYAYGMDTLSKKAFDSIHQHLSTFTLHLDTNITIPRGQNHLC
jgi:hypothetical protein